jgi:hypothetical protein
VHPSENAVLAAVERMGGHKIGHSGELLEAGKSSEKLLASSITRG